MKAAIFSSGPYKWCQDFSSIHHERASELVPDADSLLCRRREVREMSQATEFPKVNKTSLVKAKNQQLPLLMHLEHLLFV